MLLSSLQGKYIFLWGISFGILPFPLIVNVVSDTECEISPNDVSSVNEVEQPLELPEELHAIDTNYTDAIVFDDEASIKSLASIEKRMLVVSESTSYAVDLRISNYGVEFDKNDKKSPPSSMKLLTEYNAIFGG